MRLTPTEQHRLLTFTAARFAREAISRGLALSAPEAVAVIADEMHWSARAGRTYPQVADDGRAALRAEQVLPGVPDLLEEIRVEPVFADGPRLVVLRYPLGRPATPETGAPPLSPPDERPRRQLELTNTSPRVIRVSSHYPLAQLNRRLVFDREAARGFRLDLPAGDLLRLGPGERRTVGIVAITASSAAQRP